MHHRYLAPILLTASLLPGAMHATPFAAGLPGQIEGAADGVLTPGPQLTGAGNAVSGNVAVTHARLTDVQFTAIGASLTLDDRLELSAAQPNLGAGSSDDARQNVFAARLRLAGSARAPLRPAASVGVSHRRQRDFGLEDRIGIAPERRNDWDATLSAGGGYRLGPSQAVLVHATARYTRANAGGLFGFGNAEHDHHRVQLEGAVHTSLTSRLSISGEYRENRHQPATDPGDPWWSAYAGYGVNEDVHLALGWQDLGRLGGKPRQNGPFIALRGRY
ncbi:DUF3034 family protein [Aquisalimonas sp.]|uniref:DUF3034 family protein n=1 Tax=unclassified Aquisalimonas TaxID=2644645 RepID=UPI0025C4A00B|nr:DUF3034 family protein [Aquisalimonas sp.]